MRRSRQIVAVVVLASALAAEGTLFAAPAREAAANTSTLAGRWVKKISDGLQRTMTAQPFLAGQRNGFAVVSRVSIIRPSDAAAVDVSPLPLMPFQFRLPPPADITIA